MLPLWRLEQHVSCAAAIPGQQTSVAAGPCPPRSTYSRVNRVSAMHVRGRAAQLAACSVKQYRPCKVQPCMAPQQTPGQSPNGCKMHWQCRFRLESISYHPCGACCMDLHRPLVGNDDCDVCAMASSSADGISESISNVVSSSYCWTVTP